VLNLIANLRYQEGLMDELRSAAEPKEILRLLTEAL